MGGKAGAEGARYICPQCFTVHYQNDVLFAARRPSGRCDIRQAARRYVLQPHAAFAQWCEAGETAALLNWRRLPQSRRRWEEGAITAVRDLDGSWVTQRVCPCCHTPLSPPCPVVFGWGRGGMDGRIASDLLRCAAETAPAFWTMRSEEGLLLRYDYLVDYAGAAVLGVPAAMERAQSGYWRNFRRRCCSCAAGAVVRLKLRVDADGALDDAEAIQTLYDLLDTCGHSGVELKMSAVFLLEGLEDQPNAVERFQQECVPLARHIEYDFENSCFAVGAQDCPQTAVQAAEWLSEHMGRLRAGE